MSARHTAPPVLVLLGTGGTIAGTAAHAEDDIGYAAATLAIDQLLSAVPALQTLHTRLEAQQILQRDSKDLDAADWLLMARHTATALQRPEVRGVVLTHGTDTLEETAWFLHRCLPVSNKPVILVSAMRPATSQQADGPKNLLDGCRVALSGQFTGVLAVAAGAVHHALHVQKVQPFAIPAFSSGAVGPLATVEGERIQLLPLLPPSKLDEAKAHSVLQAGAYTALLSVNPLQCPAPAVAWLTSHAGFDARLITSVAQAGLDGLLVAATGNGTLHHAMVGALATAAANGLTIKICSRCAEGAIVVGNETPRWPALPLPPAKARVELLMELWQARLL